MSAHLRTVIRRLGFTSSVPIILAFKNQVLPPTIDYASLWHNVSLWAGPLIANWVATGNETLQSRRMMIRRKNRKMRRKLTDRINSPAGQVCRGCGYTPQALQLRKAVFGKNHLDTFTSMNYLAVSLYLQGKDADADGHG